MKTIQKTATIAIATSTTVSGEVLVPDGYDLVGMFAPVCTGVALTFQAAAAVGGTFVAVANAANTAISLTISATAHYIALDPLLFQGLQNIKLVSGTVELADRVFTLVFAKRPT